MVGTCREETGKCSHSAPDVEGRTQRRRKLIDKEPVVVGVVVRWILGKEGDAVEVLSNLGRGGGHL